MQITTVHEALRWASSFLEANQCEVKVAEILLLDELNWTKTDLITKLREEIKPEIYTNFQRKVRQHAETKVPVQHLTGIEQFYGRTFQVNRHVLIPRPETEELVQLVLEKVKLASFICVDVGTGSGVIAITLAREWKDKDKNAQIIATDLSEEALEVAKQNAHVHSAQIAFNQGDFLKPLIEQGKKVDIIVSNPPYIAYEEADQLEEIVRNYDPELALFADKQGLFAYEQIIKQSSYVLNKKGSIFFEIGHTQAAPVVRLIQEQFPESDIEVFQDINGKDRIVSAVLT